MKLSYPSTERNRAPIGEVLSEWLPASGLVLEVASGSGEHAAYFAGKFRHLEWQPTDTDPSALASIEAWRADSGLLNLLEPVVLDAAAETWPVENADVVLNINMVHISPWEAALGLLDGAARVLPLRGSLILYGPWLVQEVPTAPSNLAFDEDLRRRNSAWGLRNLEDFVAEADKRGLVCDARREMPANNLMLRFNRR